MGNILQDMMGLLSRKKVVKEVESTDFLVLGRTPNPEDSMFVTPKMTNELISIKDLKSHFDVGEVTGSGTTGFFPLYTDGANSVIGDSQLRQGQLNNGLYQIRMENTDRFIINKPSSVTGGDPEYLVQQDGVSKVSFGWDDDGGGFGFLYNYSGAGLKLGAEGNNPMLEIKTTVGSEEIDLHKSVKFVDYGTGTQTGTVAYTLAVDSSGKVIETTGGGGTVGGSGTVNTIALFTPDGTTIGDSPITNPSFSDIKMSGNAILPQYSYLYFGEDISNQLILSNNLSGASLKQTGSGTLEISCETDVLIRSNSGGIGGEALAKFTKDGSIELYYDNVKKFETTGNTIKISGVPVHADNAAATTAGLTVGEVYRTDDFLKIVH